MSSRVFRQLICTLMAAAVLFAQTAVAAYACSRMPGTATALQLHAAAVPTVAAPVGGAMPPASPDRHAGMPPHEGTGMDHGHDGRMAPPVPSLCMGHCQFGQQSADHAPAPAPSPALLVSSYVVAPPGPSAEGQVRRIVSPTQGWPPPGGPPHAILHCCLRD